jgi:hypothetical protein
VIEGDLNTPLSPIDKSSRQKINKETSEFLHTLDQVNIIDVYRVFHTTIMQYPFFSAAHGSFSKIDHILGHKPLANIIKLRKKKTQINKIKDEKGDITTNTNKIQRIIREYFENLYSNKLENLDKIDKFLNVYNNPKFN